MNIVNQSPELACAGTHLPAQAASHTASLDRGSFDRESLDWGQQLARHGAWLRKVILIRTGEPQAVDEVFQQVSLAAIEQRAPLADPAKAAPWLHRLAVIKSARYRRQLGRQRKVLAGLAHAAPPTSSDVDLPDLMTWLLRESASNKRQALARLPRDAEMLLLKYAERWSYRRLSEHLGITEKSVDALAARPSPASTRACRPRHHQQRSMNLPNFEPDFVRPSEDFSLDDLDRLVAGELDEPSRQQLLAWCDREPLGWKRCALAFLEAQVWEQSFASLASRRANHTVNTSASDTVSIATIDSKHETNGHASVSRVSEWITRRPSTHAAPAKAAPQWSGATLAHGAPARPRSPPCCWRQSLSAPSWAESPVGDSTSNRWPRRRKCMASRTSAMPRRIIDRNPRDQSQPHRSSSTTGSARRHSICRRKEWRHSAGHHRATARRGNGPHVFSRRQLNRRAFPNTSVGNGR